MEKFNLLDVKINLNIAKQVCTNISYYDFERFTTMWYLNNDINGAYKIINTIFKKGYSVMDILDSYFQFIKITTILIP